MINESQGRRKHEAKIIFNGKENSGTVPLKTKGPRPRSYNLTGYKNPRIEIQAKFNLSMVP